MAEINLMENYPRTKRDITGRLAVKSEEVRTVARQFGKDFFDGDRNFGYGGYYYNSKFWQPVIPTFQKHFNLTSDSNVLDVGCGKGFMLHDLAELIPGISIAGIDISKYAISNAMDDIKPFVKVASATELPFEDNSFDVVISVNTIHNLEKYECAQAVREIQRVSRGNGFISVDAYRNDEDKKLMEAWNLTAKTIMHVDKWIMFFKENGYTGDYYWFIP